MPHIITFLPSGLQLPVSDGQTILQAALARHFHFPWGCNAGSCGVCEGHLRLGRVRLKGSDDSLGPDQPAAQALCCCLAYPLEDCTIEANRVLGPGQHPLQTLTATVLRVEAVNADVQIVQLRLPAGKKGRFSAGQYLELLPDPNVSAAAFSIANAPRTDRTLDLHIRANPDSDSYRALAPRLRPGELIRLRMPLGAITPQALQDATQILLLAGSTGFAQAQALLEALLQQGDTRPMHLYWGGRQRADLYRHEALLQLAARHPQVRYVPVLSDAADGPGRHGRVHRAVLDDLRDFHGWKIVGCGSPGLVYAALDDFVAAGMQPAQLLSDVFAYAPRL